MGLRWVWETWGEERSCNGVARIASSTDMGGRKGDCMLASVILTDF